MITLISVAILCMLQSHVPRVPKTPVLWREMTWTRPGVHKCASTGELTPRSSLNLLANAIGWGSTRLNGKGLLSTNACASSNATNLRRKVRIWHIGTLRPRQRSDGGRAQLCSMHSPMSSSGICARECPARYMVGRVVYRLEAAETTQQVHDPEELLGRSSSCTASASTNHPHGCEGG